VTCERQRGEVHVPLRLLGAGATTAIVAATTVGLAHGAVGNGSPTNAAKNSSSSSTSSTSTSSSTVSSTTTVHVSRGAIGLIGDSLSLQSTSDEQNDLRIDHWAPITLNAWLGRRIPSDATTQPPYSGLAALQQIRTSTADPPTWVVELGTNDVAAVGNNATAIRMQIEAMLGAIGPGHRIVWVNIHRGDQLAASATFNRVLAEIASERTDLVVANWAAIATTPGYLLSDGIHLTTAGQTAFASLITRTADQAWSSTMERSTAR
jgi:lysophospholipase L1-like esterase